MPDFGEIAVGQDIPELRQTVTAEALVRYAGASDDYVYLHWDKARVLDEGFPDVIVHGWLTFAYMCRAVTDWIPPEIADVRAFAVRYLRPTHPGEVTCGGKVAAKRDEGRQLDLSVWARGAGGQVTTTATVTVAFV